MARDRARKFCRRCNGVAALHRAPCWSRPGCPSRPVSGPVSRPGHELRFGALQPSAVHVIDDACCKPGRGFHASQRHFAPPVPGDRRGAWGDCRRATAGACPGRDDAVGGGARSAVVPGWPAALPPRRDGQGHRVQGFLARHAGPRHRGLARPAIPRDDAAPAARGPRVAGAGPVRAGRRAATRRADRRRPSRRRRDRDAGSGLLRPLLRGSRAGSGHDGPARRAGDLARLRTLPRGTEAAAVQRRDLGMGRRGAAAAAQVIWRGAVRADRRSRPARRGRVLADEELHHLARGNRQGHQVAR